ncbi:MAG: hypothetical protein ACE5IY_18445 [bacterium]
MPGKSKPIVDGLWNEHVTQENYASKEKYQDSVLVQYKLYVEMADRISARRNLANTFFLTLHTFILGASGFLYEKGPELSNKNVLVIPFLALLALCFAWWRLVKSYRQINSAKFKVIGEFETRLPTSPWWLAEWKALGEGKDPKLYRPLTVVENWVPLIFALLYGVGLAFLFVS